MTLPAGWYPVAGDPPGTNRYWDGEAFTTGPKRNANARSRAGFAKPNTATKWKHANFVSRAVSALIDYGAPVAIVVGIANGMGVGFPGRSLSAWTDEPRLLMAIGITILVNSVVLVGLFGVSLGRILMGLRVVDARNRDRSPGLARALLRFLLVVPTIPATAMVFLLGQRRGVHDLAAGTTVVYA